MKTLRFPLTLIALGVVAGIMVASILLPTPDTVLYGFAVCMLIFAGISSFARRKPVLLVFPPYIAVILAVLAGAGIYMVHHPSTDPKHFMHFVSQNQTTTAISAEVLQKLKATPSYDRYICKITRIDRHDVNGRILLNIARDPGNSELLAGQRVFLNAVINKHNPPLNPYQFNYGRYLEHKSVYAQIRTSADHIILLEKPHKGILYYASQIRHRIHHQLAMSGFNKDELNIVLALVLGQQQEISLQVLQDYQFAGAVHILSVSGLHVGFILLFLNFFLERLPYGRARHYIRLVVVIAGLWSFAVIAGLAPSVIRSVTMFSFVAVGMHMRRDTNIFHTLLVSMLLILIINPGFLFDVGFQLSYASLFFILWVQPIFSGFYSPKSRISKYLYDILTVSVAAQLGAMPISIFYFHQFPGLFFITNLIILPFTGVIMAVSVLVMLLALAGTTFDYLLLALEHMIRALNGMIHQIASIEPFVIRDIPMSITILVTSYITIITIVLLLEKRSVVRLYICLISVAVLQSSLLSTNREKSRGNELIVFNRWKSSLLVERNGKTLTAMSADGLSEADHSFLIAPYALENYITVSRNAPLHNLLYFNGTRILRLDSTSVLPNCNPDVLLLTYSPQINLERAIREYRPRVIVADASNYKTYIQMWRKTCEKLNVRFHTTTEQGYFIIK
jgi:competence protein ComEC